jgi:hypothetical protein
MLQTDIDKRLGEYRTRRAGELTFLDKDLESVLPEKGMLADYVQYGQGQESPLAFHVLAFLAMLGASIRGTAWVEQRR